MMSAILNLLRNSIFLCIPFFSPKILCMLKKSENKKYFIVSQMAFWKNLLNLEEEGGMKLVLTSLIHWSKKDGLPKRLTTNFATGYFRASDIGASRFLLFIVRNVGGWLYQKKIYR